MAILAKLLKNFKYNQTVNSDIRLINAGPFRELLVDKKGKVYSNYSMKTLSTVTPAGRIIQRPNKSIRLWKICAAVWFDQPVRFFVDTNEDEMYKRACAALRFAQQHDEDLELILMDIDIDKMPIIPISKNQFYYFKTGMILNKFRVKTIFPDQYRKIDWEILNECSVEFVQDFKQISLQVEDEYKALKHLSSSPVVNSIDDIGEMDEAEDEEVFDAPFIEDENDDDEVIICELSKLFARREKLYEEIKEVNKQIKAKALLLNAK